MKKILTLIFLMTFSVSGAGASEYLGTISTDPDSLPEVFDDPAGDQNFDEEADDESGGSDQEDRTDDVFARQPAVAVILPPKPATAGEDANPKAQDEADLKEKKNSPSAPRDGKVAGVKIFRDHELLRGADGEIYIIEGEAKKHVVNLEELRKYRNRPILSATAEQLSRYHDRNHLDGCLVREKGDPKVYVIEGGRKRHIRSIEELRARYFGLEISDIGREEIGLY